MDLSGRQGHFRGNASVEHQLCPIAVIQTGSWPLLAVAQQAQTSRSGILAICH